MHVFQNIKLDSLYLLKYKICHAKISLTHFMHIAKLNTKAKRSFSAATPLLMLHIDCQSYCHYNHKSMGIQAVLPKICCKVIDNKLP